MASGDTIAAISSAVGPAARMIVRASGPAALSILQKLAESESLRPSSASRLQIEITGLAVPAWVYCFAAPKSVTGEDVVEFHIPGNPLLARMLLEELIRLGARQAEAGEFTARSYFNGRIDLAEAEGVAATIAAQSQRELTAARQLLAGELARRLRPVMDLIAETLALVEVGIDFTDEEVTFLSKPEVEARIASAQKSLTELVSQSAQFERLSHEPRIVLVGRPNAGKSTLLNTLAGTNRAVVSDQAGTTRDAIWAQVSLPRGMVRLIDVAGIDDETGGDVIALQMRRQALQTIEQADVVLLVREIIDEQPYINAGRNADLSIATKLDLAPSRKTQELAVSAKTGENLVELRLRLDQLAFGASSAGGANLALNARHLQEIAGAMESLKLAGNELHAGPEVIAVELREALDALGRILGSVSPDDLLGRIFSRFCIGK